jgi:hypothetical protein
MIPLSALSGEAMTRKRAYHFLFLIVILFQACDTSDRPARKETASARYLARETKIDSARFSVIFPDGCEVEYARDTTQQNVGPVHGEVWSGYCDPTLPQCFAMEFATADIPVAAESFSEMDLLVEGGRIGATREFKGTVLHQDRYDGPTWRGIDLMLSGTIVDKVGYSRYRIVSVGPRMYSLSYWTYDKNELTNPRVERFFDSFTIKE